MRNSALVAAALGIGLPVFAGIQISAADADGKPQIQKWEYQTMKEPSNTLDYNSVRTRLNKLGADGWEVCGISTDAQFNFATVVFKRPLKEGKAENNASSK